MKLSPTAQATLLLTCHFPNAGNEDAKPLTNAEWGHFALWLKDKALSPADLLTSDPKALLGGWCDARVSSDRLIDLLNRGHSLALAVEKWLRAGLWVVTRSDPEYPWRLKQRLKTDSPPVLFGCGNKTLLNARGLAVIGSRNANGEDLSFTEQVAVKTAIGNMAVISGGARGVDETAMVGAMHRGGAVIGVMADSLLKAATSAKWRKGIMDGHVVLISPFSPEAGFSTGNAMARNKYIYCLADTALVIHAGTKGGTINGAEENLRKGWVPLWVKPTADKEAANQDLVARGGYWCEADIQRLNISTLFSVSSPAAEQKNAYLLPTPAQDDLFLAAENDHTVAQVTADNIATPTVQEVAVSSAGSLLETKVAPVDFYQLFIIELQRLATIPVTLEALIETTGLHKSQLNDWLQRATGEGAVKKLNRPTRYQVEMNK